VLFLFEGVVATEFDCAVISLVVVLSSMVVLFLKHTSMLLLS
jgi:hypothetical protein